MNKRFTLIELLVVIVILSILVSIGVSGFNYVTYQNKLNVTRTQINKLEMALEQYRAEYGDYYFNCLVSGGSAEILEQPAEFNPMSNPGAEGESLNEKDFKKNEFGMIKFCSLSESNKNELDESYNPKTYLGDEYSYYSSENSTAKAPTGFRDGWGNLLIYQYPGEINQTKYDLYSRGADGEGLLFQEKGQTDEDDITNWTKK